MRKLSLIAEQINQCKEFIINGDIPHLRMAFVLLDNAAEILMYRKIEYEFERDDYWNILRKQAEQIRSSQPLLINCPSPVPELKRQKILKYFDEKTFFLSEDRDYIHPSKTKALRLLHRYRNETFHRDKVRRETIKPLTILYFEIVCDLLVDLDPHHFSISSEDNWNDFYQKYNLHTKDIYNGNALLETLKNNFKKELNITASSLKEQLTEHLLNRFEEAFEGLEFIRHGLYQNSETLGDALKKVQLLESGKQVDFSNFNQEFQSFRPKYTLKSFDDWKESIKKFSNDKLNLLSEFVEIEEDFEKLEIQINSSVFKLDSAIQAEIDRRRGK